MEGSWPKAARAPKGDDHYPKNKYQASSEPRIRQSNTRIEIEETIAPKAAD